MRNSVLLTIALIVVCLYATADDPAYYTKDATWQESMRLSREALLRMEQSGELGVPLPDLGVSDFTIMTWVKTEAESVPLIAKAAARRRGGGYSRNSRRGTSQRKSLQITNGAPVYSVSQAGAFDSEKKINDGQWHHIALVGCDPLEFYIDGKRVKKGRIGNSKKVHPDNPSHVFQIGIRSRRGRRGDDKEEASSDIDELRIYNRRLSADEVQGVYENPAKKGADLAGWLAFEETERMTFDEKAIDSSGNNYHGRMFRVDACEGRFGRGIRIGGRGGVLLPPSIGVTARAGLWDIVSKDFSDEQATKEIERERADNIWAADWKPGDMKELGGRYAKATREVGRLNKDAVKLSKRINKSTDLRKVTDLYHASIFSDELRADLPGRVVALRSGITRLAENHGSTYSDASDFLMRTNKLEKLLAEFEEDPGNMDLISQLRDGVKNLQYEALISANPLMDFDKLMFIKRYTYQSSHYYTDFIDGCENPGGNLCILSLKDGKVTDLVPSMSGGIFGRFDLSFDAKKVLFDWKRKIGEGFRIYEVYVDGTGLRQLTFPPPDEEERIRIYDNSVNGGTARIYMHHTDDMHPCYLPEGRICFTSTRCEYGTLCDGPDHLTTAVLYLMNGDGSDMRKLTNSAVSEFAPAIMHDGRIIYSRWEYIDKGQIGVKCLWAMRPDGTMTQEIYGNDIAFPPVMTTPRPIPGSNNLFVMMGTPHCPQSGVGTVIRIDINEKVRTKAPMTYITPALDIRTEGGFHHKQEDGSWQKNPYGPLYMDPFPLSEEFYLVSHNPDKIWNDVRAYGLYFLDEFGNHVRIYQDPEFSSWQPVPLRPRKKPPIIPPVHLPEKDYATIAMTNVYQGLEGIEPGTIKYLRIMEQVPRPWDCRRFWEEGGGAPGVSKGSVLGLKVMHGIVPVYEDGSAYFTVPPDVNLYFEALDENYMEIQRMRTYVNFLPGEKRSCFGCHEYRQEAPPNKFPMALKHPPSKPGPQPGEIAPRVIHYPTDVQPVLDKHCIKCHSGDKMAAGLNLTGEMTWGSSVSYEQILERGLVATFDEGSDYEGTEQSLPKTVGSHASKFIAQVLEGCPGNEVKMPIEDFVKLTTWVDSNAQYYGSYYGRQDIMHKGHPNFRPVPTFEVAINPKSPLPMDKR